MYSFNRKIMRLYKKELVRRKLSKSITTYKENFSNIFSKKHTIQKKPLDQTEYCFNNITYYLPSPPPLPRESVQTIKINLISISVNRLINWITIITSIDCFQTEGKQSSLDLIRTVRINWTPLHHRLFSINK